jgi:uncharacterized protein (TIGR02270 family)
MPERIQCVLDGVGDDQEKVRALVSALGWIPYGTAEPQIRALLESGSLLQKYIGIAASAIHRRHPGQILEKVLDDGDPLLVTRALRAFGELGRGCDLSPFVLREGLSHDDEETRFSTAWSASLAGNQEAVEVLKSLAMQDSPWKEKALELGLRRMEHKAALAWQLQLAQAAATRRLGVQGAGIIVDPVLVPWLLEQMKTPDLARIAGEAFTMITGADIDREELRGMSPEGFEAGPSDDPNDCNVAMDPDENLPWPDPELIALWWDKNAGRYVSGARYLIGHPISAEHLRHVLRNGRQRQRAAAALELAILEPGRPLFEVRAPGFRQIEMLRSAF